MHRHTNSPFSGVLSALVVSAGHPPQPKLSTLKGKGGERRLSRKAHSVATRTVCYLEVRRQSEVRAGLVTQVSVWAAKRKFGARVYTNNPDISPPSSVLDSGIVCESNVFRL